MEWRRIKTIIIAMLAVVNCFLLVLVGSRMSEAYRYERSALEGAIQVLARNGIAMEASAVSGRSGSQPGAAQRSIAAEAELASSLLQETLAGEDRGGGLYIYSNRLGEIRFRGGGELSAELADDPVWMTEDPEAHAQTLLNKLRIEARLTDSAVWEGSGQVVYQQLLEGIPLFSCQIVFTYDGGRLTSMSGCLLTVEEIDFEQGDGLNLPTALMRFLDEVISSGDVCSEILQVEPGYLMGQSLPNAVRLRSVWYISTNTADYYVDGATGALIRSVES